MNLIKRAMHRAFALSIRAWERLFLDRHVWGRENIPAGAKIVVVNHISSHDAFRIISVFPEPLHCVIGPGFHSPLIARLLHALEHINVMSERGKEVPVEAAKYLARGESVCIAPEGDIHEPFHLGRFFPGVARIYRQHPAPILPVALVAPRHSLREYPRRNTIIDGRVYRMVLVKRGPYCINFGEPWMPDCTGKSDAKALLYITRGLEERMATLVDDVRQHRFWLD